MRKTQKILTALTLSVAMALSLFGTQAFAAGTKTVQINGYSEEELGTAKPQLEINNILSEINLDKSMKITAITDEGEELWTKPDRIDAAYNANGPVTIKTLDDGYIFEAYKLQKDVNIFNFDFDKSVPYTSGQLQVSDSEDNTKTIDFSSLKDDDYVLSILKGSTVTLTEPGCYFVLFRYDYLSDATEVFVNVGGGANANPTTPVKTAANPTFTKITVNGKQVAFDAFLIDGSNYIKLRDFAAAVNGTSRQFEVTYDNVNDAILLAPRLPYTPVGKELTPGDGSVKDALPCAQDIFYDEIEIALRAYTIGGFNYFKLRDLAKACNIGLSWDGTTSTAAISTASGYEG